jgi:cell shape-determining protein MreD
MHPVAERAKTEARKILVTAVFFAIGFCIIVLHNRLLVEGSHIQVASYARALVGGLIAAKVLLTVDMLPFFEAFPQKPMIYNIAWKTSLYSVGAMVVLYLDPFLRHLVKGAGLYASHHQAWQGLMLPRTWATMIWTVVLLLVFVTTREIDSVLGKDQLKYMFLGQRRRPAAEVRSRKVA